MDILFYLFCAILFNDELLPLDNVDLLISDKFADVIASKTIDNIRQFIDDDPDPIEIMTKSILTSSNIIKIIMSYDDYKYFTPDLNIKKA